MENTPKFYRNSSNTSFRPTFHAHSGGELSPAHAPFKPQTSSRSRSGSFAPMIASTPFFQTPHHNSCLAASSTIHSSTSASTSSSRHSPSMDITMPGSKVDSVVARRRNLTSGSESDGESHGYRSAPNTRNNPTTGPKHQKCTRKSTTLRNRTHERDALTGRPTNINLSGSDLRNEIRRQRIESEQRQRKELRDGYAELKRALPKSSEKSSKVSLIDHAITHIRELENSEASLQTELEKAEDELARLKSIREGLMRNKAERHGAAVAVAVSNAHIAWSGHHHHTLH